VATIERRPNIVGLLIVLFAVVGGGVVWAATRSSSEGPAAPSSVASTSSATSTRAAPLTSPSTTVAQASVVDLQLPSPSGVVLFAHTAAPNAVLRIDIDQHRVVSTPVGPVMSTAPAFLAVGPSAAVIRPYDNVPGYVVADSGAVTDPPGRLDDGTFMVCSDGRSNRLWVADESLLQVDFNGSLQAQIGGAQRPWAIGCDGAGEMLFQQGGATKVTGIEAPTLVTSNNLIAAGPRTFLVRECATATACPLTVVDRATGERRSLTLDVAITDPQSLLP